MRKIIYGLGTSLDGYIARLDGSLDFLQLRPSNYSMWPFFKTIDVGWMGRKTYEASVRMIGELVIGLVVLPLIFVSHGGSLL